MPLLKKGYLTYEELKELRAVPSDERYAKGAVAVIECVQEIPCNPCETACPAHALCVGDPIINLPCLTEDKCTGCGVCVAKCPGMAIFVVNKAYSEQTATVAFPYEYAPLPHEGAGVRAVDRAGQDVCAGKIVKVMNPAAFDRTPVVTVEIPKQYADQVRGIERGTF